MDEAKRAQISDTLRKIQGTLGNISSMVPKMSSADRAMASKALGQATTNLQGTSGGGSYPTPVRAEVPVQTLENPVPSMNIPQMPSYNAQSVINRDGTVAYGTEYLQQLQNQRDQLGTAQSSFEQQIQDLFNKKAQEGPRKQELYDEAGIAQQRERLNQAIAGISRKTAIIHADDDRAFMDQVQLEGQGRDSRGVARNQNAIARERAIQRTAQASELRAQIAGAELMQGNLQSAVENINASIEMEFQPVKDHLEQAMFFLDRLDSRISESQRALTEERRLVIQDQQNKMEMAQALVNNAVASGSASPADIDAMYSMKDDPEAMAKYASKIIARASGRVTVDPMADLKRRKTLLELAVLGDPQAIAELGYDPNQTGIDLETLNNLETQTAESTQLLGSIDRLLGNESTLKMLTGSKTSQFLRSTKPNITESAVGASLGPFTGPLAPILARQRTAIEKQDVLNELDYLVNNQGFKSLIDLKQQGVTFGSLTDSERQAAYSAGVAVASAIKRDKEGEIVGIKGSYDALVRNIKKMQEGIQRNQDRTNAQLGGMSPADAQLIDSL